MNRDSSQSDYWAQFWRRRASRRGLLRGAAVTAAGLGAAAFVGCGDDDDGGSSGSSATAVATSAGATNSAGASATANSSAPRAGGVATLAYFTHAFAPHLDPHQSPTLTMPRIIWGKLVRIVAKEDDTQSLPVEFEGYMAESWEQPDPLSLIFKIRDDVMWHPPLSRAFTAEDVIYSLTRQRDLQVTAGQLSAIESWVAGTGNTVEMKLNAPNPDIIFTLADARTNTLVARESVEENGDLKNGPSVGTGPYMMKEWRAEQGYTLTKFPDFHLTGKPYIDEITFPEFQDQTLWTAAFRDGAILNYTGGGPFAAVESLKQLMEENPDVGYGETAPAVATNFIWAPAFKGNTQDIRVRQALSMAIDRQVLIDTASDGSGVFMPQTALPGVDWVHPDIEELLAFKPEEAKAMFDQAGVGDWQPRLTHRSDSPIYGILAQIVQAQWKEVLGLDVILDPVDNATIQQKLWVDADVDLALDSGQGINSPTASLEARFKTGGGSNVMQQSNAQLDQLIEDQAVAETEEERRDLFNQIQEILFEEAAYAPLYSPLQLDIWRPELHGYSFGNLLLAGEPTFDNYWLSESS